MTDLKYPRRIRVWTLGRIGALVLAILTLAAGLALFSGRAWAAFVAVPETGTPGHLSLQATPLSASFQNMSPGSTEYWQIDANLADEISPLTVQFARDGALVSRPDGLNLTVQRCLQTWTEQPSGPTCASGAIPVFGPIPASDLSFGALTSNGYALAGSAPVFAAGFVSAARATHVLVTLNIPDTPEARADKTLMGLEATIGLGFTAKGGSTRIVEDPPVLSPDRPAVLTATGADAMALGLLALGAVGLGLVLRGARRARTLTSDRKASS